MQRVTASTNVIKIRRSETLTSKQPGGEAYSTISAPEFTTNIHYWGILYCYSVISLWLICLAKFWTPSAQLFSLSSTSDSAHYVIHPPNVSHMRESTNALISTHNLLYSTKLTLRDHRVIVNLVSERSCVEFTIKKRQRTQKQPSQCSTRFHVHLL